MICKLIKLEAFQSPSKQQKNNDTVYKNKEKKSKLYVVQTFNQHRLVNASLQNLRPKHPMW